MRWTLAMVVTLLAQVALADASWLTSRGRLIPQIRVEAWGAPASAGVGIVVPEKPEAHAALAAEALWFFNARVLELRAGRVWQLTENRFGTLSAAVNESIFVVPEGQFDVGTGPHGSLTLALGGDHFTVDLGVQSGVEVFVHGQPRFPERVLLALNFHASVFSISLMSRGGVDLVPGHNVVFRGDFIFAVGWLGLGELEAH